MAMAYIVGLTIVALLVAGALAYALLRYASEVEDRKRQQAKFEHIKQMAREKRDYDEIMAYVEQDADTLDSELDDTDDY